MKHAATKTGFRAFTVHEEKRLTGAFKLVRAGDGWQMLCEVEIEKVRTQEQRERYTTFRPARPEDHDLTRTRSRT